MREPFELTLKDGTTLSLKYSFKAIRFFEKLTGGNFFGDSANGRIGADYLAAGLAAGLLWRSPHVKQDDVDSMIERHMDAGGDLPALIEGLMEALKKAGVLKGAEEGTVDEPRPTMSLVDAAPPKTPLL
jgi:hypothetical protein